MQYLCKLYKYNFKTNLMKHMNRLLFILAVFVSSSVFAQTVSVTGLVKDSSEIPVIGASVIDVTNRTSGAVTDIDGRFTMTASANAVFEVSCIGYATQTVALDGRTNLVITLLEDSEYLDEVVVVGYGTIRKRDLTGAVASIDDKAVKDRPVGNIGQALQGKVSGVQIIDAGKPGDNVTIRVRGLGTINNSEPLIVIDGVPTDLGLSAINTADIDRIDVLKDASATAIYGARGANGVVMVTTKKGQSGKGQVAVTANWAMQQVSYIPPMLNAQEYAEYSNDMLSAAGYATNPLWTDPSTLGEGTDWIDELLQTGLLQNYTVSYSGGSDKSRYYFSGGFQKHDGIVKTVGYNRFTFQANSDNQVLDWLKFTTNITFSTDKKTSGSYSMTSAMNALPTQPVKDEDGSWSGPEGNSYWYGDVRNPIGTLYTNSNKTNGYNFLANISGEIRFTKWLTFKSTFGYDAKFWFADNFYQAYPYKPTAVEESTRYMNSNKSFTYLSDNYFTFDHTFAGKHYVNAMAGTSAQWNDYDYFNGTKGGFLFDNVHEFDNGTVEKSLGGSSSDWAMLSFMARANYTYDDRFLVTATFRRDGSSRFGPNHRWGNFPSASVAWRMSNEQWWPSSSIVNDFKVRTGYGVTGSDKIGSYQYIPTYTTGEYPFGENVSSTLMALSMANTSIHWEEVHQANVGVDMSMFKSRVNVSLDGYIKNTSDMLVKAAIPITSGFEDVMDTYTNAGTVKNVGAELAIHSVNFEGANNGFRWETSLNVSWNTNKITALNSATPKYENEKNGAYITIQKTGYPVNSFFGYVTNGIFQTEKEVDSYATQQAGTAPGDIRFKDLNNDGKIDEKDRTIIGNPNPDWLFSMTNDFYWKGFSLSIYLQGVQGNDIFNVNNIANEGMSSAHNQTKSVLYRWKGYGTSTFLPRAVYGDPNQNNRISDRFVEDGSYLRLKNVTLGYVLPRKWTEAIHMEQIRLYLSCDNLVTLTKYSGFDPEVSLNGLDNNLFPLSRTFSFGVNFNF